MHFMVLLKFETKNKFDGRLNRRGIVRESGFWFSGLAKRVTVKDRYKVQINVRVLVLPIVTLHFTLVFGE